MPTGMAMNMHSRDHDWNGDLVSFRAVAAPVRWVLVRIHGVRDPQAFLCTGLERRRSRFSDGSSIVGRSNDVSGKPRASWRRDATAMVRSRHRTDDAGVFGLFRSLRFGRPIPKSPAAFAEIGRWYHKREPSFSDAMAAVRRLFWSARIYQCPARPDGVEIPAALLERLTEALCYAA